MAVTVGQAALATINLIISQGADNTYVFRYSTDVNGTLTPIDLSGYSARAQIRNKVGGTLYLEITDITLGADGTILVRIPHTATEGLEWRTRTNGVWDLELIAPDGGVMRFASGTIQVSMNVTTSLD